jgi:leucyl-tRNA synthetase
VLKKVTEGKLETGTLIRELLKEPEMREHAKEIANMIPKVAEEITKMPDTKRKTQLDIGTLDEYEILEEAKDFLKEDFKTEIHIFKEDNQKRYDPKQRAKLAKPYRPAIFIE